MKTSFEYEKRMKKLIKALKNDAVLNENIRNYIQFSGHTEPQKMLTYKKCEVIPKLYLKIKPTLIIGNGTNILDNYFSFMEATSLNLIKNELINSIKFSTNFDGENGYCYSKDAIVLDLYSHPDVSKFKEKTRNVIRELSSCMKKYSLNESAFSIMELGFNSRGKDELDYLQFLSEITAEFIKESFPSEKRLNLLLMQNEELSTYLNRRLVNIKKYAKRDYGLSR